jgi:hypothetical protein
VFRINSLRAVANRLSHMPVAMRASSSMPFVFNALARTDSKHRDKLCNTSILASGEFTLLGCDSYKRANQHDIAHDQDHDGADDCRDQ